MIFITHRIYYMSHLQYHLYHCPANPKLSSCVLPYPEHATSIPGAMHLHKISFEDFGCVIDLIYPPQYSPDS